jgi:ATP synthase protein I
LDSEEKDKKEKRNRFIRYALIPFVLSVPPIVGWAIGRHMDSIFDTTPYLMYVFILLGLASGVREFLRIIKEIGE